MEESEADAVGDEEVQGQDEGTMARAAPEVGVANITWDPEDPFLEFTDKNSSTAQTLVAAWTPVLMLAKETMPGFKESSFKEPRVEEPQAEEP